MHPDRQAMINGSKPSEGDEKPSVLSPRRDPNNRISKPARPQINRPLQTKAKAPAYLTSDEQSERFVADEDRFVLKQSKKKADIRVREGRATPIDLLAFGLRYVDADRDVFDDDDADVDIEVPSPEAVLDSIVNDAAQLETLDADVASYLALETNPRNREYWVAVQALCRHKSQQLKPSGPEGRAVASVATEVDAILAPKTYEQLETLETQIRAKLSSGGPVDTDYWESLMESLLVYKARTKLRRVCDDIRHARVALLKDRDPEKAAAVAKGVQLPANKPDARAVPRVEAKTTIPGSSTEPPPGTARFAALGNEDFSSATKALYDREVARGIEEDEEVFQAEEALPSTEARPQWAEKYRPRKPRYFNRVQMGYEWNKYNQTHYDHDNPPPKVVHGYRFNIFYPDLIDKTKAPTYKIMREGGRRRGESFAPAGQEDTCLIRFIAGPPYQDIAFRIVDREWDYSAKKERGFKSTFDKGILQLHFQFKRVFYRK